MSWSHECGRRIIFENLFGTNAVSFKGVDIFQQLHTSSVPWGERQHRGEIDRHCLAPFCWRKAHCCFQIRMIGHFFRNYVWLHSLHAFSGPMQIFNQNLLQTPWIIIKVEAKPLSRDPSHNIESKESFSINFSSLDKRYRILMDWLMTKKMLSKRIMPYICNWWQGRKKSFTLGDNYECLAIRQTLTLTSQDHVTWKWLTVT